MSVNKEPVLIGGSLLIGVATLGLWHFQALLDPPDWLTYLIQVFSGNWSPDYGKVEDVTAGHSRFLYLLGAIFAVLLNLLTIAAVLTAARNMLKNREINMQIRNALTAKDVLVKDFILASVPESQLASLRPIVEKAFKTSTELWEKEVLPELVGADAAHRVLSLLKSDLGPN